MADGRYTRVIDVSNPCDPTEAAFFDNVGYAYDVKVVGHYAYIADDRYGLRVLDVQDPLHPQEVAYYDAPGYAVTVVKVVGGYVYMAEYGPDNGLSITEFCGEEVEVEEDRRPPARSSQLTATVVRGVLWLPAAASSDTQAPSWLLDAVGRRVMRLRPGPNDVQHLSPGVYFASCPRSVERLVLTR